MLDTLITSKTRIKLLIKFFLNPELKGYLRGLEEEFQEGSNAIRLELNRFTKAGLLQAETSGNRKYYRANQQHPLFWDLNQLVRKYMGLDQIVFRIVGKIGDLKAVYITGHWARGIESQLVDLVIVGEVVNKSYIILLAEKAEKLIDRRIRWVVFNPAEFDLSKSEFQDLLLVWES